MNMPITLLQPSIITKTSPPIGMAPFLRHPTKMGLRTTQSSTQNAKVHKNKLTRFNHTATATLEHLPHRYNEPNYGQHYKLFYPVTTELLTPVQQKSVQEFIGTFLYYARAIENNIFYALGFTANKITTSSWPDLHYRMKQLLNYAATHPYAKLKYITNAMHLWIHSDASYLNGPKAQSRAGGYLYLSEKPNQPIKATKKPPTLNATIQLYLSTSKSLILSYTLPNN